MSKRKAPARKRGLVLAVLVFLAGCASAPPPASVAVSAADRFAVMKMATVRLEAGHGHGSGVIVSPDYILTAAHVAVHAPLVVRFTDGTTGLATLIWKDDGRDVAIMKLVTPTKLAPAKLSRTAPHVGDTIFAVGYPLELPLSIQIGEVASEEPANGRDAAAIIVINCTVAPGDSGGPVFNEAGEVVGLNDLQFIEPMDENGKVMAPSALNGMVGMQFIIADIHAQIGI